MEATYLTVRPVSISAAERSGARGARQARRLVEDKTKLVSSTTFLDTISNVILASSIGLIFSEFFGPLGWVYSAVVGSFTIMIFLFLFPRAIGIENSVRMATWLGPSSLAFVRVLSPVAVPLTNLASTLSRRVMGGKPSYSTEGLVDEFEELVALLELGGHIEPDAGRIIRNALGSSKKVASDTLTPLNEIVSARSSSRVSEVLKLMGTSNHARLPIYDESKGEYLGVITFRSLSRAIADGRFDDLASDHMTQAAMVEATEPIAGIMEGMQKARTTVAFVYDEGKMVGMVTLTDILEQLLGIRIQ